jgi:hypothetical protein
MDDAAITGRPVLGVEKGRSRMAAFVVAVDARCPLCGSLVLSVGRGGRLSAEDLHPVPLYRRGGAVEGYMVCDQCAVLAQLPADITLN